MIRPTHITEERIRERAYRLWLEEGQPQGKDFEHWEKARELLALEADPEEGKDGVAEGHSKPGPWGEPAVTDQGEKKVPKKRRPSMTRTPKPRPM
ncbi:DUF2934 domain-containing protein [Nordella sp. HKS 07]|uniref:DUF2934 domain-containing protein n=1 Tax=Nordella sp. HKS 07 TaxID=2712222 RepID=UPI0013E12B2F|nr:DUF2934 domain-containing protein [Nordella sp. HKS 07]QIG50804.1 DUF2934 domain-containing protein [Nordella sp. HKS 07]